MSFPTNPSNNSTTVVNGITYTFESASNSWTRRPAANNIGITYTATNGFAPATPRAGDQWYNIPEDVKEKEIEGKVENGVLILSLPIDKKKSLERLISLN
jgi:hypothetical protein